MEKVEEGEAKGDQEKEVQEWRKERKKMLRRVT